MIANNYHRSLDGWLLFKGVSCVVLYRLSSKEIWTIIWSSFCSTQLQVLVVLQSQLRLDNCRKFLCGSQFRYQSLAFSSSFGTLTIIIIIRRVLPIDTIVQQHRFQNICWTLVVRIVHRPCQQLASIKQAAIHPDHSDKGLESSCC